MMNTLILKVTGRKGKAVAIAALLCILSGVSPCRAQQTDPTLTAAVLAQTAELKSIHNKRKKTQERIIAAETAVTLAFDRVHRVEDKMLEYLSNAQDAMQNLYQIKRASELVLTEIPQNCALLSKSVGGNQKGTAIAAIVSDELTDAAARGRQHPSDYLHRRQRKNREDHRPLNAPMFWYLALSYFHIYFNITTLLILFCENFIIVFLVKTLYVRLYVRVYGRGVRVGLL